jgi:hypothetical protein
MGVVEQLRTLYRTALEGTIDHETWLARHSETLAGHEPDVDDTGLDLLAAEVGDAAAAATDDVDRWMFLCRLQKNLELLRLPDPDRELRGLETALSTLTGEQSRADVRRQADALRAMKPGTTPGTTPPGYEPGTRMIKALRVGTLEETYRWLQAAVAERPGATVQDLLTRAAVEVAEAKLELDRYDALRSDPGGRPVR